MYQSVDDIDESGAKSETKGNVNRLKLIAGVLLGIAVLVAIAIYSSQNSQPKPIDNSAADDAYEIYTKALTERDPALRRARLLDFTHTYPDNDRKMAAEAQLQVLNYADDTDWASVTEVVFDPAQSRPAKLAAIDLYEEIWGTDLLGSREAEIEELRNKLQKLTTEAPKEEESGVETPDFTPPPDSFDPNVEATIMAGGVDSAERRYIPPNTGNQSSSFSRAAIVKARIRKGVEPRYPRRAERRGVKAEVIVSLNVDENGRVQMVELISARTNRYRNDFIRSAERAALSSRFHPKTIDGMPVPSSGVILKYTFDPAE